MLKTLAAMLLATTAVVPALAQDNQQDHAGWHHGGQRGEDRGARPEGARPEGGRPGGWQRGPGNAQGYQPRPEMARPEMMQHARPQMSQPQPQARPAVPHQPGGWDRGNYYNHGTANPNPGGWDRGHYYNHGGMTPGGQPQGHGWRGDRGRDHDGDRVQNGYRGAFHGEQGWGRDRGDQDRGRWNGGWRHDDRYDWRDWRAGHREIFRLPRYRSPYGWGYRRFGIGVRIAPAFFAENYWIDDPFYYHLPPAYGPYRWVRYYNDALLVDIETGLVVDEIPDFFF